MAGVKALLVNPAKPPQQLVHKSAGVFFASSEQPSTSQVLTEDSNPPEAEPFLERLFLSADTDIS